MSIEMYRKEIVKMEQSPGSNSEELQAPESENNDAFSHSHSVDDITSNESSIDEHFKDDLEDNLNAESGNHNVSFVPQDGSIIDATRDQPSSASSQTSAVVCNVTKKKRNPKSRLIVGTSENPLDVTDITMDSGSLLDLYQNDYFDTYMHMYHLYHRKEAGVHEYLVNLLYSKRSQQEVEFYLPQLCQLSIAKQGKSSLHRFLLDKASSSMDFALPLSWFYQAIIEDECPKEGDLAHKMTQETEMAVVNCKLFTPTHVGMENKVKELDISSINLLGRRSAVKAILEFKGERDNFNTCTNIQFLEKPVIFPQYASYMFTLTCSESKIKIPSPFTKIGNPLDIETQPSNIDTSEDLKLELHRLLMKQRRLEYFNTINSFVRLCMEVSHLLTLEQRRDAREPLLRTFISALNKWMLVRRCIVAAYEESFAYTGLNFPLKCLGVASGTSVPYQFLKMIESEMTIFFSRKRVPFVLYMEIANLDEDITDCLWDNDGITCFSQLYVYHAIVQDLIQCGLLQPIEVNSIQNPLECIRYSIGMLPPESIKRCDDMANATNNFSIVESQSSNTSTTIQQCSFDTTSAKFCLSMEKPLSPKNVNLDAMTSEETRRVIWPELLNEKKRRLRAASPYGVLKTWDLKAVIIKGGDDLRQENMVNQLLFLFKQIFQEAGLPLWLHPIEILVTGANSGIMEFLHDTCSVDVIKRKFNVENVAKVFEKVFANDIHEARKNFIESHAAYSIISYLLQVKDRHNGNILLDSKGHVIHIDYGFCLSNCPGNINFETSPFKLTREYMNIIGGEHSDNFDYFKTLVIRGLLETRKHVDRIVLLVEMMTTASKMPCFSGGVAYSIEALRERFMQTTSEDTCIERIISMIDESVYNFRTVQYDNFQRLTNGIK